MIASVGLFQQINPADNPCEKLLLQYIETEKFMSKLINATLILTEVWKFLRSSRHVQIVDKS